MAAPNWAASAGEPLLNTGIFSGGNIIDAEFETVSRDTVVAFTSSLFAAPPAPVNTETTPLDQLSLLRGEAAGQTSQPDRLSPAFMFFTLLAAFVVFWVSGGHVLLY